jgi:hypothetical protein
MTREYFYAKIGAANNLADKYLNGISEIGAPAIPIYFEGESSNEEQFLKKKVSQEQGENFFRCAKNPNCSYIIIIHNGFLHVLTPCGEVKFKESAIFKTGEKEKDAIGQLKLLPVKKLPELTFPISDVPAVLATMRANRYYSSGTFRHIQDIGCNKAIDKILSHPIQSPEPFHPKNIFICMGSIEIETMIAKIFEEKGCHVPAYRGGNTVGIDIFAHNDSNAVIRIKDKCIKPGTRTSIQVKRGHQTKKPEGCDHFISAESDAEWLLKELKTTPKTLEWVKRSLDWLPSDYLRLNGLP